MSPQDAARIAAERAHRATRPDHVAALCAYLAHGRYSLPESSVADRATVAARSAEAPTVGQGAMPALVVMGDRLLLDGQDVTPSVVGPAWLLATPVKDAKDRPCAMCGHVSDYTDRALRPWLARRLGAKLGEMICASHVTGLGLAIEDAR